MKSILVFYNIDIILAHFSFAKPIEILDTFILMASWCHQHESMRIWSMERT